MQIEVYKMTAEDDALTITLEAICDTFSSLLWDIEYYKCGSFEVYIAANPQNVDIFQPGRIVGRDDDSQHFGIIESVLINTDVENGDYLTIKGRCNVHWFLFERAAVNCGEHQFDRHSVPRSNQKRHRGASEKGGKNGQWTSAHDRCYE